MYLFSFDYPPLGGGIARLCSELARELALRGELEGVLTSGEAPSPQRGAIEEIRLGSARPQRELRALRFLRARARDTGVLCGTYWPEAALVLAATRRAPAVIVHGTELLRGRGPREWFRQKLRHAALSRAQVVFANSRFTANLVGEAVPGARCVVLPLAVDHHRFSPGDQSAARVRLGLPAEPRVVISVGRVHRYKGHATVIEALGKLEAALQQRILYVVVGDGPATGHLRDVARRVGVGDRVRYTGTVTEEELPDYYRAADLHALLSEQVAGKVEGFGLVSLEAQASGIPALGSRSGGIGEAISEGHGGWLIEPGDVDATARHLRELVTNPEQYRAAGRSGRQRVLDECTWARCADAVLRELGRAPPGALRAER